MELFFLANLLVVGVTSLPTGPPSGPYVLDLSGGASPGQVIGRVDSSGSLVPVPIDAIPGTLPPPDPPATQPSVVNNIPLESVVQNIPPAGNQPTDGPSNVAVDPVVPSNLVNPDPINTILEPGPVSKVVDPAPVNTVGDRGPVSNVGGPGSISNFPEPIPTGYLVDPIPTGFVAGPSPTENVAVPVPVNNLVDPVLVNNIPTNPVGVAPNTPTDGVRVQMAGSGNVQPRRLVPFDQGGLVPPSTANPIDWTCEGYRPNALNANSYEVFFNNQWTAYTCFGILIWEQSSCRCVVPPDTGNVDPNCPNNRAHPIDQTMYHIKHWGVWLTEPKQCPPNQLWNQTGCRCDWDPVGPGAVVDAPMGGICDLMFNASFTTSLRDDANYNSIGKEPWFNVEVQNGTARLNAGRMPVWAFASNDFGKDFQIETDYKVDNIPATANSYTTLVSNDCDYDRPSVSISYRPFDQSYRVYFRDQYSNMTLGCNSPSPFPYAFQSLSLEYQSSRLSLKVNGVVCVESFQFGGDVAISRCPFYLGGNGHQDYMTGNLDNVIVRRYCVVPA